MNNLGIDRISIKYSILLKRNLVYSTNVKMAMPERRD